MALFSCSETYAVLLSAETVTYSGSRSCATVAPARPMRTSEGSSALRAPPVLKAWKSKVVAVSAGTPLRTVMMEIEPSGSMPSVAKALLSSPSLATTRCLPSGEKATPSGSAPTVTFFRKVAAPLASSA